MGVSDWFRWIFTAYSKPDATAAAVEALAASQVALTARLDTLTALHEDLVRQVGEQQTSATKQLTDLRNIVTQLGEKAKEKPAAARSMADIRRFVGDDDA